MNNVPDYRNSRSSLIWRVAPLLLLLVVGAAVMIAFADGVGYSIGGGLIAVAMVLVLANVFFEIGRSEDRDRERERRNRSKS